MMVGSRYHYLYSLSNVSNLMDNYLNFLPSRHVLLKYEHLVGWHLCLRDIILGHPDLPRNSCILVKVLLAWCPLSLRVTASSSNSCLACAQVLLQTISCHTIFRGKDSQGIEWACGEEETFNRYHSSSRWCNQTFFLLILPSLSGFITLGFKIAWLP